MKAATKNKVKTAVSKAAKTTTEAAKKAGEYATSNPKTVLYMLGGVALLFVGYEIYRNFSDLKITEEHKADLEDDPDFPPSELNSAQALSIAERLYTAMSSTFKSNKEEVKAIFEALKGLNVNDFIKVVNAFGTRQYSLYWANVGDPITSDKHHLITWLSNELDVEDQNKLMDLIPGLQL